MSTRMKTWHPMERREEALALHNAGLGYRRVAERMELPLNTVKSWVRRYGQGLDEVYATPSTEETSREQISEQVEYIPLAEMGERRLFLVCGPYDFRGKIDGFLTKIPEMLAENVTVGDVCNSRGRIRVLQPFAISGQRITVAGGWFCDDV